MDRQAYQRAVEDALEEAEKGVFISGEKIFIWLGQLGANPNAPAPEPRVFKRKIPIERK